MLYFHKVFLVVGIAFIFFTVKRTHAIPVLAEILEIWDIVEKMNDLKDDPHTEIINGLTKIQDTVKHTQDQVQEVRSVVKSIQTVLTNMDLNDNLKDMYEIIDEVTIRAEKIEDFKKHTDYDEKTLRDFAKWAIGQHSDSIEYLLKKLSNIFIGPKTGPARQPNVLQQLSNWLKESPTRVCSTNLTAQHFLYLFYVDVLSIELQAFTMAQFSYMIYQTYDKRSYKRERTDLFEDFQERASQMKSSLIESLTHADGTLWKCDPKNQVKGETFEELTRLLQGYAVLEHDLKKGTCHGVCSDTKGPLDSYTCDSDACKSQPKCNGIIRDCQDINLFKPSACLALDSVSSLFQFTICTPCMCICEEESDKSDIYFNLREVRSNIAEGMVVTGLRFRKLNRIIHLQIQEGKLLDKGSIGKYSLRWVPLENYKITDPGVQEGVDFHKMTYDSRAVALDTVRSANSRMIVAGVQLEVMNKYLQLKLLFAPFNLTSPKPWSADVPNYSSYSLRDISKMTSIDLVEPDVSIKTVGSTPIWGDNKYVKFTHTDIKKDAAQTTVPFIDLQEVTSNPPVAMSGAGLYFKGKTGFGGYIAPKLITYDFATFLTNE